MIPTSAIGLVLFVTLLSPGLAYVLRHEQVVPAQSLSAFRETLRVVFMSVVCLTATGLLFAVLRFFLPRHTPNVRGLIRDPNDFAREHHVQLAWWALGLLAFATLLGALAADPRAVAALQRAKAKKWYKRLTGYSQTTILDVSAWYRTIELHRHDAEALVVGAQLDSGAYVQGDLFTYSVASREDEHRDLVLTAPIELRTADGVTHTLDVKYSVISARHIVRLDVTPVQPEPVDEPEG
ncbi:DUF6338 family protein [Micromonospora aurantiaca (nom. illeg.)]|uniref:DUF6338 family protein n=1 Tax=Micromonospora aurantiaca (nom. illeg.) TaxID=47850 RepID=UPI000828ABE3|nr:DUF6338 family protein [Micromonospora aurantiaca]SCL43080.1 hypothetical protein GA0070615_6241 [Micromonospora aurantiaca]